MKKACEFCKGEICSPRKNSKFCSRSCSIKMNHKNGCYNYDMLRTINIGRPSIFKGVTNPELSKRQTENNVSKRPKVREKMSKAKLKYYREDGNHPWNYIDGTSRNRKYRKAEWLVKIKEIYERDNWTCQDCGKHGDLLNAHHILPWTGNPEKAFDDDNIITLCVPCHSRRHKTQEISK